MSPEAESPLAPEGYAGLLRSLCPAFALELAAPVIAGLSSYLAELDVWRRRTNLTGNLSAEELSSHALESVLGSGLIAHGERVVDIGSGAGFPGLPLAIARPDLSVSLVEPRGKRCAFLRHVARSLSLANLRVIEGRIEKVGGQTFGAATTRAVGGLPALLAEPRFLDPGGFFLAWTTDPETLAASLGPGFALETTVAVPGSSKRRIARYRRL